MTYNWNLSPEANRAKEEGAIRRKLYAPTPPAPAMIAPAQGLEYIRAKSPELASMVDACTRLHPKLALRAQRAALMVIAQKVVILAEPRDVPMPYATGTQYAEVESTDGKRKYIISKTTRDYHRSYYCTCDDATAPISPVAGRTCQHIVAYFMAVDMAISTALKL